MSRAGSSTGTLYGKGLPKTRLPKIFDVVFGHWVARIVELCLLLSERNKWHAWRRHSRGHGCLEVCVLHRLSMQTQHFTLPSKQFMVRIATPFISFPGLYFAESITKVRQKSSANTLWSELNGQADEYAKPNSEGRYAVGWPRKCQRAAGQKQRVDWVVTTSMRGSSSW